MTLVTKHDEGWSPSAGLALQANCILPRYSWREPVPKATKRREERREPEQGGFPGLREAQETCVLKTDTARASFCAQGMALGLSIGGGGSPEPCALQILDGQAHCA